MKPYPSRQGVNANDLLCQIAENPDRYFANAPDDKKTTIRIAAKQILKGLKGKRCIDQHDVKEYVSALKMIGDYGLRHSDMTIEVVGNQIKDSRIACIDCLNKNCATRENLRQQENTTM